MNEIILLGILLSTMFASCQSVPAPEPHGPLPSQKQIGLGIIDCPLSGKLSM